MNRHTLLLNKVLGLCIPIYGWPKPLLRHGYRVISVEKRVRVGNRTAVPDIILLNEKAGHVLVLDCKGGANIKADQDGRYAQMGLQEITEAVEPTLTATSCTFAYAVDEEHVERIRAHTSHALIVFGSRSVYGIGNFGHEPLTRELQGSVSLGASPRPRFFIYPYSINDAAGDIDAHVASSMQSLLLPGQAMRLEANRATAGVVFRTAHPLHGRYSPAHAAELVEVTRLSIGRILARRDMGDRPRARQDGFK